MTPSLGALLRELDEVMADAVALRRELHAQPELGGQEHETCARLEAALAPLEVRRFTPTGLMVRLGSPDVPAVVVRAELDGLPVAERTGADFASATGKMHACGHDVHMASLVCLVRALSRLLDGDDVPIVALFQPSEEISPSGAKMLLDQARDVGPARAVGAAHVHPEIPFGQVAAPPGAINASSDEIQIQVRGAATHGAYPHRGRDPVLALSAIVVALQQVVSRQIDPVRPAVVSIGRFLADGGHNVIPEEAVALGTLRAVSERERASLRAAVDSVVKHVAAAHGCAAVLTVEDGEPVLVNDAGLAARFGEALPETGQALAEPFMSCGSDDFAYYSPWGPLLMQFVGVAGAQVLGDVPLHDPRFLPTDAAVRAVAASAATFYVAASAAPARQSV